MCLDESSVLCWLLSWDLFSEAVFHPVSFFSFFFPSKHSKQEMHWVSICFSRKWNYILYVLAFQYTQGHKNFSWVQEQIWCCLHKSVLVFQEEISYVYISHFIKLDTGSKLPEKSVWYCTAVSVNYSGRTWLHTIIQQKVLEICWYILSEVQHHLFHDHDSSKCISGFYTRISRCL